MFSLGCVLYLLITGEKLFDGSTHKGILEANKECNIKLDCENLDKLDREIKDLLIFLLEKDPKQRISAKDILELNLFKNNIKLIEVDEIIETAIPSNTNSPDSIDLFMKLEILEMTG